MKQYHQEIVNLSQEHQIAICYECDCRGAGYTMGHSRAHAHTKERKVCLSSVPKGFPSFFTALHEIGHLVAEKADYVSGIPRSLAEHNATEWAKQKCKELEIPVKRKTLEKYNVYIRNKIARGLRRGLKVVPRELRKY